MYLRSCWLTAPFGLALLSTAAFAQGLDYKIVADWLKLPEGRTEIGNMHGDVAVSAAGEVYISVQPTAGKEIPSTGPKPGLQVYSADGKFLRNVPNAPSDFHGFIIQKEAAGEFIYGIRLAGGRGASDPPEVTAENQTRNGLDKQAIVKMTLDGKVALAIPPTAIPDEFKAKSPSGQPFLRLSGIAVAPNGDIYATDGYSSSYIHRFDRSGKYIKSFGGKDAPYGFSNLHKMAIDTRFTPARIIGCDRANGRVVHMSLDGDFLSVVAQDMDTPSAVAIRGDYVAIAEIALANTKRAAGKYAQITILDKAGKVVAAFGNNTTLDEIGVPTTPPAKWRTGAVTAPHGVAFNAQGDVFVTEFNQWGRVHRFNLQPQTAARR